MTIALKHHVQYGNSEQNLLFGNGQVELLLPTAYGPRVARYAFPGGPNLFAEVDPREQRVETAFGDAWHIYGGHRLWSAPEHAQESYYPDNTPVRVSHDARTVTLTQSVEPHTGLEKSLSLTLYEGSSRVAVEHRLRNLGCEPRVLAPWALSAMAPGGVGIFPQSPFAPHPQALAPARPLVLWSFTRMADARSTWGDEFILLRQDAAARQPQKFGCYSERGYMAYALGEQLFIKCHEPMPGDHADFGCNVETFTNELFLELETLGPLVQLPLGETVLHREEWFLLPIALRAFDESTLRSTMAGALAKISTELEQHGDRPALVRVLSA